MKFLPRPLQSTLAVTLMPTISAALWNVPPSPRFAAGPSLSRPAGEGQVDGVCEQVNGICVKVYEVYAQVDAACVTADIVIRQFNGSHKKIDVACGKLHHRFSWIVTSPIRSIYFPGNILPDGDCQISTTNSAIRRAAGHASLPLARLREREGPAAKRWEGEGARSPATTFHEAPRTPSHPRSNPINSSSLSLALASLPSSSSAAIWRLSL
jgi:hypothetical protein